MKSQYRAKIEKITVSVEKEQQQVLSQKDAILSEITKVLKQTGQEQLVQQLEHLQYLIDDAMYLAIYKEAIASTRAYKVVPHKTGTIKITNLVTKSLS